LGARGWGGFLESSGDYGLICRESFGYDSIEAGPDSTYLEPYANEQFFHKFPKI
jgi:hypothetical protein